MSTCYPWNTIDDDDCDSDNSDNIVYLREMRMNRTYEVEDLDEDEKLERKQLKQKQQEEIIKEPSSRIKYNENSVITTRQLIIEEQRNPFKNRQRLTLLNRRLYNMEAKLVDLDNTGVLATVRYNKNNTDFHVNNNNNNNNTKSSKTALPPISTNTDDTSTSSSLASTIGLVSESSISRRGSLESTSPSPISNRDVVKKLPKTKESLSPPPPPATTTTTAEPQQFEVGDRVYVPKSKFIYTM